MTTSATTSAVASVRRKPVHERLGAEPQREHHQDRHPGDEAEPGPAVRRRHVRSSAFGEVSTGRMVHRRRVDRLARAAGRRRPGARAVAGGAAAARRRSRSSRSLQPAAQGGGEPVGIVGRHQHAGGAAGRRPPQGGRRRRVTTTGTACASASVTRHAVGLPPRGRHQQVRARSGRTPAVPGQRPGESHPVADPRPRRQVPQPGDEVRLEDQAPTQVSYQSRSATWASAESRMSWPLARVTAARHSSRPPGREPQVTGAGSTPGVATRTRSGDSP